MNEWEKLEVMARSYNMDKIYKEYFNMNDDYTSDREANPRERNDMKKCEVKLPDENGKLSIGMGCMFISPATNGFMVYTNPEGTVEINCFTDINGVIGFLGDNKLMDLTQTKVINNV